MKSNNYGLLRRQFIDSEIKYEDSLLNHRLTWMWTLQALLFTAFGFILENPQNRRFAILICVLGISSSISIGLILYIGGRNLHLLNKEKSTLYESYGVKKYKKLDRFEWLFPWNLLPVIFLIAWLVSLTFLW